MMKKGQILFYEEKPLKTNVLKQKYFQYLCYPYDSVGGLLWITFYMMTHKKIIFRVISKPFCQNP